MMSEYEYLGHWGDCPTCFPRVRLLKYLEVPTPGRYERLRRNLPVIGIKTEEELKRFLGDLLHTRGRRRRKAWGKLLSRVDDVDRKEKERNPGLVRLVEAFRKISPSVRRRFAA